MLQADPAHPLGGMAWDKGIPSALRGPDPSFSLA